VAVAVEPAPVETREEEPANLPPPPATLRLLGVMSGTKAPSALLSVDDDTPAWVTQGDPIAGWYLSAIGPNWIELSLDGEVLHLELYPR
jgi:hypothetical protein